MPTAKAFRMLETHAAMNKLAPRRFLLRLPFKRNFTTKKEKALITAVMKTLAPKLVIPLSLFLKNGLLILKVSASE
jgi:hypothetical protein